MGAATFTFYNIEVKKTSGASSVYVTGDITNNTTRDYHTAVFRVSLFQKSILVWTGALKIYNFHRNQTKSLNYFLENFDLTMLHLVSRCDIYFESGY